MRNAALLLSLLALGAGCRRAGTDPIDPGNPSLYPPCATDAPHLVVGLQASSSTTDQAVIRFTRELRQCAGLVLPYSSFGTLATVGGLPDGTDLVGFSGDYSRGGSVVRFDLGAEIGRVEDPSFEPIGLAALTFSGQPAIAVVWGSGASSSDSGERLDVYAATRGMERLGSWDTSYELVRVAAATSGRADRLSAAIGGGLQEYRSDPGATSLATTGELQVAAPTGVGYLRSLDVFGEHARAAVDKGVLSWRTGIAPAFLGPVQCRWPDTIGTLLPVDGADYVGAAIDLRTPEDTLAVIDGELEGGSSERAHLYLLRPRGECERVGSMPSGYRAVAVAWSGR